MAEFGCLFMGRYNPDYHHRRSIRLRGYDYSRSGLYFVTICIQNRECLLGRVEDGVFLANEYGETIEKGLDDMVLRYPGITVESWVVMPNHMHCIVEIIQSSERNGHPFTLGEWVRLFKYDITKQINRLRNSPGVRVWQRNYYENIIRNEPSHQIIQNYIKNNPIRWTIDQLHPKIHPNGNDTTRRGAPPAPENPSVQPDRPKIHLIDRSIHWSIARKSIRLIDRRIPGRKGADGAPLQVTPSSLRHSSGWGNYRFNSRRNDRW